MPDGCCGAVFAAEEPREIPESPNPPELAVPPEGPEEPPEASRPAAVRMTVDGVAVEPESRTPVVILTDPDRTECLPIFIGEAEASAIWRYLNKVEAPRPMTHDLLAGVIEKFGGTVTRVTVTALRRGVFYAAIDIELNGKTFSIDARPSDAIALALRLGVEVYVAQDVMDQAGHRPVPEPEPEPDAPEMETPDADMPGPI